MFRKLALALIGLVIVVACIFGSASYRLFVGNSMKRGAELREILAGAKSVTASEYAVVVPSGTPVFSELLAEKTLSPVEVERFIKAFSATGKLSGGMCFEPHHLLHCTMPEGLVRDIYICFRCNNMQVDQAAPVSMSPWSASLKQAFADCGLPVRPDIYRVGRSASTDSGDEFQNP